MVGCFESKCSSVFVPKFLWGWKENWTISHKVTLTRPMKEKLTWTPLEKLWTNGPFLDRHYSWYSSTLFTGLFQLQCNLICIYFFSPEVNLACIHLSGLCRYFSILCTYLLSIAYTWNILHNINSTFITKPFHNEANIRLKSHLKKNKNI